MTIRIRPDPVRADLLAAAAALALVALAVAVGAALALAGRPVGAPAAPLFAHLLPHVGPGTPLALAVAGLVVWYGPALAARLRWPALLGLGYAAALAWTCALALVDGWQRGLAGRLTTRPEYLSEVPGVTDVSTMLHGFTGRILDGQPDSWSTHVAGHPPGALLVFVGMDRIGRGGGGWAALLCVLAGASVAVTVPLTVRALAGPRAARAARAAVPFLVLFPGAVWVGASADGLFTGVTAAGVAMLACATRRRGPVAVATAVGGGGLLGLACFLSYGLVLMAPIAFAVLLIARRLALLPAALLGTAAVVASFAVAGFWWLDGYQLVVERYYQGIASDRPYPYWVWANLACLVACAGPAVAPILRRAALATLPAPRQIPWQLLPMAALLAILVADVSGLSKAEVERIWLPFAVWLLAGSAGLPAASRRWWLAGQAVTALAVNHLLLTTW
jgi:methylthioxylose transferase